MREMPFTPIYEIARQQLKLTRDEYALCAYVQFWSTDPDNKLPGWCDEHKKNIAAWIGITRAGLYKMVERLVGEDLLQADEKTGFLRVTKAWLRAITTARADMEARKLGVNKVDTIGENDVNKVDAARQQSLQGGVNFVDDTNNSNNNKEENIGAKAPVSKKPKKEKLTVPTWMVEIFSEHYAAAFPGLGSFGFQKKHFGANGFAGIYARLVKRIVEKQAAAGIEVQEVEEAKVKAAYAAYLDAAVQTEWVLNGWFTPFGLLDHFDKIVQSWQAKLKKDKKPATPTNDPTAAKYEPLPGGYFNERQQSPQQQ